jgi:hypothetical protein
MKKPPLANCGGGITGKAGGITLSGLFLLGCGPGMSPGSIKMGINYK